MDVLLLVDYPFDEDPSTGRKDALETAERARARRRQWTLALQAEGFAGLNSGRPLEAESIERLLPDFELLRDVVVDAPCWDRARKSARELLSIDTLSDLPSSPAQSRRLRSIDEALNRLVEVPLELSPRVKSARTLAEVLSSLSTDEGGRLQRLAAMAAGPQLEVVEETARSGDEELRALRQLLQFRAQLGWIRAHRWLHPGA